MKTHKKLLQALAFGLAMLMMVLGASGSLDSMASASSRLMMGQAGDVKRFSVVMSGSSIVPAPTSSNASASAGAILRGNRLLVRGDFKNLTSPLRDYSMDPATPPNPNITSGVHIHQGEANQNGPFQFAMKVEVGSDQVSGKFRDEIMLSNEQLDALNNGKLYMDIHTRQLRAGEVRGTFRPV